MQELQVLDNDFICPISAHVFSDCDRSCFSLGSYGKFWEQDLKQYTAVNTINNRAPIELTHAFLKVMVPRGRGRILQVASMASFLAGPNEALYHATKAHLRTLSNGLREELSGSGVSVTTLAPGPFKTSFWKSDTKQTVAYLCALVLTPDAALTAKQAVHATMRGRRLMIPGWTMQLTKVLVDVLPLSWGTKVGMIFWVDLPAGVFSLLKKMGME
jgi:short-subunit dehydrogenase